MLPGKALARDLLARIVVLRREMVVVVTWQP
jgi:hypothetical protein